MFRGVPWCSGVFRSVPGCSGVFRCSGVPGFSTCRCSRSIFPKKGGKIMAMGITILEGNT